MKTTRAAFIYMAVLLFLISGTTTSATSELHAAGAAFGNGSNIAAFPGAYHFLFSRNFGVECSQGFIFFANSGSTGKYMTGVIECPFGFAGWTGIKQRIRKTSVFGQEFRDGISWLIKFENVRMLLYLVVNGFVQ